MKKLLLILGLTLGLSGCYPSMPDGDGVIAYTHNDALVLQVGSDKLIGQVTTLTGTGSKKGPKWNRMTQQFEASNGVLTCSAQPTEFWGGSPDGKAYNTEINCSDGSKGKIRLTVEHWNHGGWGNNGFKGMGVGKLNNGKNLRLVFGPSINVTSTDF